MEIYQGCAHQTLEKNGKVVIPNNPVQSDRPNPTIKKNKRIRGFPIEPISKLFLVKSIRLFKIIVSVLISNGTHYSSVLFKTNAERRI